MVSCFFIDMSQSLSLSVYLSCLAEWLQRDNGRDRSEMSRAEFREGSIDSTEAHRQRERERERERTEDFDLLFFLFGFLLNGARQLYIDKDFPFCFISFFTFMSYSLLI